MTLNNGIKSDGKKPPRLMPGVVFNNVMKIKILSILIGITSLLFFFMMIFPVVGLFKFGGYSNIRFFFNNPRLISIWVTPLLFIGLFVSSFGLFKEKKWGYILSNFSLLLIFICSLLPIVHHFFPTIFDTEVQFSPGRILFLHMEISLTSFIESLIIFVLLFSLKF